MTRAPSCGTRKPLQPKAQSLFWNPYLIGVSVTPLVVLWWLPWSRETGPQLSRY